MGSAAPHLPGEPTLEAFVLCRAVERTRFKDLRDKLLCHVIARGTHKGVCSHLSHKALARAAQISERALPGRLAQLEADGKIKQRVGINRAGGRAHNEYIITIPVLPEDARDQREKWAEEPNGSLATDLAAGITEQDAKANGRTAPAQPQTGTTPAADEEEPNGKKAGGLPSNAQTQRSSQLSSQRARVRPRPAGQETEKAPSRSLHPQEGEGAGDHDDSTHADPNGSKTGHLAAGPRKAGLASIAREIVRAANDHELLDQPPSADDDEAIDQAAHITSTIEAAQEQNIHDPVIGVILDLAGRAEGLTVA